MDMPIIPHAHTRLPPIFTRQTRRPHKCKLCKKHCFCKMRILAHVAPEAVGTPYPCSLGIFGFGKDLSMFARHFRLAVFERASLVYDGGVMHTVDCRK